MHGKCYQLFKLLIYTVQIAENKATIIKPQLAKMTKKLNGNWLECAVPSWEFIGNIICTTLTKWTLTLSCIVLSK